MTDKIEGDADISKSKSSSEAGTQISDAAKRALAEAEERRILNEKNEAAAAREIDGRGGLDPARYGDWEKKGIAVDF